MHHFDRLLGGRDCFSLSAYSTSSTTSVYKYLLHLTLNLRLFLFFFILIAEKIKVSMIGFHQISIDQGRVGWLVGWWPNQIRRVEFKIQYQHFLFNEEVSDCGSSLLALATQLVPTRPPRTKIHLHLASFRLTMTRKSLISLICLGYFIIQKYL